MPIVSILLPCYDAAETLPEALDSLARQTLTDFEAICVDDGSADSTLSILRDWSARDSRFRVLARPHEGIISTLKAGLESCQSPFVARMDADDLAHPDRLALQVAYLQAHPETALVSCRVEGFPKKDLREGFRIYLEWLNDLVTDEDIRREMFVESPLPHPSVCFRKDWVEKVGGYQERGWPEDYDLWLRLTLAAAKFAKVPEVLLRWRERPDRLTRTDGRYSLENFLRAKAYYLACGPLAGRDAVLVWGAGMMGRRLGKQLQRQNLPLVCFVDIDPRKIEQTHRGLPIIPPEELPNWWGKYNNPAILAAVGARGARSIIRGRLNGMGFIEGEDWWAAA